MSRNSELAQDFRDWKAHKKEQRRKLAQNCPGCSLRFPNRTPSKLMPGDKCRVCGHVDER